MNFRTLLVIFGVLFCISSTVALPFAIPDCVQYTTSGNCRSCEVGYSLAQDGQSCIAMRTPQSTPNTQEQSSSPTLDQSSCNVNFCVACNSTNPEICIQCKSPYVLGNNSCVCPLNTTQVNAVCINCNVLNCDTCSSTNICQTCDSLYILNSNANICLSCNATNCVQCTSANVCSNCTVGFPSSTGATCQPCTQTGCAICNDLGTCVGCDPGYQLGSSGVCYTCNVLGCSTCSANNACSACLTGYQLIQGTPNQCVACSYPCATCNSLGVCLTCASLVYSQTPNAGVCYSCQVQFCTSCQPSTPLTCTSCITGYIVSAGKCVFQCAATNCASCNAQGVCQTCIPYYYLTSQSTCGLCNDAPNCLSCTFSSTNTTTNVTVTTCNSCSSGFYLTNGECQQCPGYCSQCSSATVCTLLKYNVGVTLFNNGLSVAVCNSGCVTCNSMNPATCTNCATGFSLTEYGQCIPCTYPCASCVDGSPSSCLSCVPGAVLNTANGTSSGTCVLCSSTCNACLSSNANTCTACPYNILNNNGVCTNPCSSNCKTCATVSSSSPSTVVCTSCFEGYTVNATGYCIPCLTGCKRCSGNDVTLCLECGPGFTLFIQSTSSVNFGACLSCPTQCNTCFQIAKVTYCKVCNPGYFINGNFGCSPMCPWPCSSCDVTNPTQCISCFAGYTLLSGSSTCSPVTSVAQTSVTGICPFGYSIYIGQCIQCSGNCARCENVTNTAACTSCGLGFYLSSTTSQCLQCPTGCMTCVNLKSCGICMPGYTIVTAPTTIASVCMPCLFPCATCQRQTSECTTCMAGFTLSGWACVTSYNLAVSVKINATYSTFVSSGQYASYIQVLQSLSQSTSPNNITSSALLPGSVITTSAVNVNQNNPSQVISSYNGLTSGLTSGNSIGGLPIISSSVQVSGGTLPNNNSVNTTVILAVCIPIGVILLIGIAVLIYCKYKKSSNIIEKKIQEDGLTVRQTFELSNDMTGRKLEAI